MKAARDSASSRGGLVVAPQSEAALEGAAVLRDGGNAADAMVTAALVQGVADPHRSGVGGFGCATVYWRREGSALAFGFHGRVGERAREDQWLAALEQAAPDGFGYVIRGKENDIGYRSITTPGTVAGLAAIHARFGTRPWAELVEHAAAAADRGFLVGPALAEFWIRPGLHGRVSTRDRLRQTEGGRSTWFDADGKTFEAGRQVRLPELAETYRRLARAGAADFYRGELAGEIAADLESNGAFVTRRDLESYAVEEEPPLEGRYRGFRVLTSPLPGGGTSLLQALKLIETANPSRHAHNSVDYVDLLARIFKTVWRDRLANHGDPRFGSAGAAELLGDSHLSSLRGEAEGALRAETDASNPESSDTTQLTIVDGEGNCVSFSHSLGYGSGVFTPGLGFMYNNCMSGFDPRPGRPASLAPGKARSTAIAETILLRDDRPFLILGSPGAARITAAIAQVIVNVVDFGMSAAEAVLHPRFDGYGGHTLFLESRFPLDGVERLRERGWDVVQSPKPFGMVGRVYAAQITAEGNLIPGVDPGEPGLAARG